MHSHPANMCTYAAVSVGDGGFHSCTIWYIKFEAHTEIAAPAARTWSIFSDVERWPQWTASMTSVELADPGPLRVGSRARVVQPRLPVAQWTVTELITPTEPTDERVPAEWSFTWISTGPGLRTTGRHLVRRTGEDRCRASVELIQEGLVGAVIGRVYRRLTECYLTLETAGLRTYAERSSG